MASVAVNGVNHLADEVPVSASDASVAVEETVRSLASVQFVHSPEPMLGADLVCLATVLGYRVVVKKTDFGFDPNRPGASEQAERALCLFFEPDSVLDRTNPDFAVFEKYKWRIKTQKLRGIISQGLAQPVALLRRYGINPDEVHEGDDVTKQTRTKKYVPPEEAIIYQARLLLGQHPFPNCVPKTDEPNLQSNLCLLASLKKYNRVVTVTEKQDGTSLTVSHDQLCGRNYEWRPLSANSAVRPDDKTVWCAHSNTRWAGHAGWYLAADELYGILEKLRKRFEETKEHIFLQCEVVGPTINGNRLGLKAIDVKCFNIFSAPLKAYLPHSRVVAICASLGIPTVSVVENCVEIPFNELPFPHDSCKDWLHLAMRREYSRGRPAEGLVVKTDDHGGNRPSVSFKVISPEYLARLK